jgi:putative membrane protein
MMGYGYDDGGAWMWFGALMILGVLVLIGLAVWAVVTVTNRPSRGANAPEASTIETGGRARTKQVLDERYAHGELNTDEYTERLHTLGL